MGGALILVLAAELLVDDDDASEDIDFDEKK